MIQIEVLQQRIRSMILKYSKGYGWNSGHYHPRTFDNAGFLQCKQIYVRPLAKYPSGSILKPKCITFMGLPEVPPNDSFVLLGTLEILVLEYHVIAFHNPHEPRHRRLPPTLPTTTRNKQLTAHSWDRIFHPPPCYVEIMVWTSSQVDLHALKKDMPIPRGYQDFSRAIRIGSRNRR
jgi:hypothetical protein